MRKVTGSGLHASHDLRGRRIKTSLTDAEERK